MKDYLTITRKPYFPYLILTLFLIGCAPDPLTRGSSTVKDTPLPLGYTESGRPLLLGDFTGTPVVLYVKNRWCPLCRRLDRVIYREELKEGNRDKLKILTLELVDRRILDTTGKKQIFYTPGEGGNFIPEPITERKEPGYFYGNSSEVVKILKLKRIPTLIGFNTLGQVAGIVYGLQTDMEEKIENLLELVMIQEEIKEKSEF